MDTIEIILQLMKERNTTAAALTRDIGLTNGLITQWKNHKQKPSANNLQKLADYFNVSVDYLLGNEEKSEKSKQLDKELEGIEFALDKEMGELTDDDKEDVLTFVRFLKAKKDKENNK